MLIEWIITLRICMSEIGKRIVIDEADTLSVLAKNMPIHKRAMLIAWMI